MKKSSYHANHTLIEASIIYLFLDRYQAPRLAWMIFWILGALAFLGSLTMDLGNWYKVYDDEEAE